MEMAIRAGALVAPVVRTACVRSTCIVGIASPSPARRGGGTDGGGRASRCRCNAGVVNRHRACNAGRVVAVRSPPVLPACDTRNADGSQRTADARLGTVDRQCDAALLR